MGCQHVTVYQCAFLLWAASVVQYQCAIPTSPNQSIPSLITNYKPGASTPRVWEAALSGRVVETLGTRPAGLTSMKRMSGEEVVALSQHESSGSSDNED